MKVKIKLIDKSLPHPEYKTSGSVAFDLCVRENVTIKPFVATLIPLNIIVETPPGYFLLLVPRSSTPMKKSLIITNGIGVIDQDYCGENDEIKLQVLNYSNQDVIVEKGERIAQAMLVKIQQIEEFKIVDKMNDKSRGGFGSTG
jgi:dUTP pyrophosphatase